MSDQALVDEVVDALVEQGVRVAHGSLNHAFEKHGRPAVAGLGSITLAKPWAAWG